MAYMKVRYSLLYYLLLGTLAIATHFIVFTDCYDGSSTSVVGKQNTYK